MHIDKEIKEVRTKCAQELKKCRAAIRQGGYKMTKAKDFNNLVISLVLHKYDDINLTKPTVNNIEDLVEDALEGWVAARCAKCPPLPCGADDSWYENNEAWRNEAKERFDGLLDLYVKMCRDAVHTPNIHAFDESYFGED